MKLLQKTLRHYLFFSVIIFSISVPVFYYLVQHLWIKDVDESLHFQKERIIEKIKELNYDHTALEKFSIAAKDFDVHISKISGLKPFTARDITYYKEEYDAVHGHLEPYRILKSVILIDQQPFSIITRKDLVENEDLIRAIVFTQSVLFLILLGGVLLLNNYHAKKTWLPFYKTVNKLKSFKIDKEEKFDTEPSDITEFKELNDSVLRLTENSIRVFKAQKEFTENAAHETQTPLAVIKSQIDLFAQDEELSSKQAEIITRIDKNLRLLTKLNRNLLLLSKIENKQFNDTESVEVRTILSEIINAFEEQVKLNGISLLVNLEGNPKINTNIFLLHSLIHNLLANAIKYNINKGTLQITLFDSGFEVTNTSNTPKLSPEKIYQRFYKNTEKTESSGLGLAIVKQICDLFNFKLEYHYHESNLHQFKVKF